MNDIAKEETAIAKQTKARGFENEVDKSDLIFPRGKLLQAMSPELQEENDLEEGQYINSITKELLPDTFVPVFFFKEYMRFNPRNTKELGFVKEYEPGALIWKTSNPEDPRVKAETLFGPNGETPLACAVLNFFSYFEGHGMPVILSFMKTGYKTGKQLLSLCRFLGGDMFSRQYTLGAKSVTNESGTFWVPTVTNAGAPSEQARNMAEGLWQDFAAKATEIKTHETTVEEPEERPY